MKPEGRQATESSFSTQTRNEVARMTGEKDCCRRAELAGILRAAGSLHLGAGRSLSVQIETDNAAVARRCLRLVRSLGVDAQVLLHTRRLGRRQRYQVRLKDGEELQRLLREVEVFDHLGRLRTGMPRRLLGRTCCRRAYLRGAFMAGGSVSHPERQHHLELGTHTAEDAATLEWLMDSFGIQARRTERRDRPLVYLKDAEAIVQFLRVIGASQSLLAYENVRILREMRSSVNRLVNAETANLNKTIHAAMEQVEDILFLERTQGLEPLPPALRELARLRLEYPDLSLRELGEQMNPPLSKSAVNHRMRRLQSLARRLRNS